MGQSPGKRTAVDRYIAEAPAFARPILQCIRQLIREAGPDLEEVIRWGSPCYKGSALVFWLGAFRAHVSLTFLQGSRLKDPSDVLIHGTGNASNRKAKFTSVDEIQVEAIRALLKESVRMDAEVCQPVATRPRRSQLPVPDELANALKVHPVAASHFERLSPSCKREYIEWIASAKRPETRQRRLGQTLEMLAKGMRRAG